MEEISAYAAYQKQMQTNAKNNNKSPKQKNNKNLNAKSHSVIPSKPIQKKRKHAEINSVHTDQPTSVVKPSVVISNGTSTTVLNSKKKKSINLNAMASQQNVRQSTTISSAIDSSIQLGKKGFKHILSNYDLKYFMSNNWEKLPVHISREHNRNYFDYLKVSTEAIDEMLRNNNIEYTKNIDVTSYENGVRSTHNPDGRALPSSVWDFYRSGCSVRLLNPQTFIGSLQQFSAMLQEYFHCFVGANVYLTPPNSQGFAPHYDDIEAFVLQIEGKKEWMLYPPRNEKEKLPRESSENFQQDEIGEPFFKGILQPGDTLYFPRGWIHQAKTVPGCHSLHITLSVYQKNSFADLFEELTKVTLKKAIDSDVAFRRGLPSDIWYNFGETYATFQNANRRKEMKSFLTRIFTKLVDYIDIDTAVDNLAIKYQHDALPPVLIASEMERTIFGTKPTLHNGKIELPEMNDDTEVRLLRANIVRLAMVDGAHHLYYYIDNSKEYHGSDLNFIEVEEDTIDVVKFLIQIYPNYVKIKDISDNIEVSMTVVCSLWDRGLLMTKNPLQ